MTGTAIQPVARNAFDRAVAKRFGRDHRGDAKSRCQALGET